MANPRSDNMVLGADPRLIQAKNPGRPRVPPLLAETGHPLMLDENGVPLQALVEYGSTMVPVYDGMGNIVSWQPAHGGKTAAMARGRGNDEVLGGVKGGGRRRDSSPDTAGEVDPNHNMLQTGIGVNASQLPPWLRWIVDNDLTRGVARSLDSAGNAIYDNTVKPIQDEMNRFGKAWDDYGNSDPDFGRPGGDRISDARQLTPAEIESLRGQWIAAGGDPSEFDDMISQNSRGVDASYIIDDVKRQRLMAENLAILADTKGEVLGHYDKEIGRLGGLLEDPNAFKTDAEYASTIANTENIFNAYANQAKQDAARLQASSGGGSLSGASMALASNADAQRNRGIANAYSSARTDVLGRKTGYEGDRSNAIERFGGVERAIRNEGYYDPSQLYDTGFSVRSAQSGRITDAAGRQIDKTLGAVGLGLDALSGFGSLGSRLFSFLPNIGKYARNSGLASVI